MKTISITRVINSIFQACGIDPAATPLSSSQKVWALSKVNTELPNGWNAEWWPDLMKVESRVIAAGPQIAFVTTGATEIGAIDADDGVFENDPRVNMNPLHVAGVTIYESILWFRDSAKWAAGKTVWLRFRPPCPIFSLTAWSGATTYAAGDLVWVEATGYTYRALQASTNQAPATQTAYWEVVGFPEFLEGWMALHVSALRMKEEDGAGRQMAYADQKLDKLRDTLVVAQERRSLRCRVRAGGAKR